jgi:hypothetical protein
MNPASGSPENVTTLKRSTTAHQLTPEREEPAQKCMVLP